MFAYYGTNLSEKYVDENCVQRAKKVLTESQANSGIKEENSYLSHYRQVSADMAIKNSKFKISIVSTEGPKALSNKTGIHL